MIKEKMKFCKKLILIIISLIVLALGILIPLLILSDNYKETNPQASTIMIVVGLIGFFIVVGVIIVYSIIARKKNNKLDLGIILESINKKELKEEFIDLDDSSKKCSFTSKGLVVNDYLIPYDKVGGIYIKNITHNAWINYSQIQLIIGDNTNEESPDYDENVDYSLRTVTILVTKDVLELIKKYNIKIENQEHFEYFMNNQEKMLKYLKPNNQIGNSFIPIILPINNEIKKEYKKYNTIALISIIALIVLSLGLTALFAFLYNTKKGIEISQFIGLKLIIKIVFSLGIIFAAFYKRKESLPPSNIYTKIILLTSLVMYWIAILINSKLCYFLIYLIIIILLGYSLYAKIKFKNSKDYYRIFIISALFFVGLLINVLSINYIDENSLFINCFIIAGVISVIAVVSGTIYYVKYYKNNEVKKKVEYWFSLVFGSFIISMLFIVTTITTINFAFDNSEPSITTYEIVNKEMTGSKNTSYYLYLEGKEDRIEVDNETYYACEIGDTIDLYQYNGILGFSYYLYNFDAK